MDYLPRLRPEFYQGDAVVHWTLTIAQHGTGWLDDHFHVSFRELLLHACVREGLVCPCYCLMPDHMHLIWMGLKPESDQRNGMSFLRTYSEPLLSPCRYQAQAHDHVLGDEERRRGSFARHCSYVLQNPVRAGLVTSSADWSCAGGIVPGYPKLHPRDEKYWEIFWKLYHQLRQFGAGTNRRLTRRST
jgi:REP element-mobilizing transposase RayT